MDGNKIINNSDWTMVCNESGSIIIFNTNRIRDFARMNRSVMKRNMFLNKGTYTMHKIPLMSMLGEVKYTGNIRSVKGILKALKKMHRLENPNMPTQNPFIHAVPTNADRARLAQTFAQMYNPPQRQRYDRKMNP